MVSLIVYLVGERMRGGGIGVRNARHCLFGVELEMAIIFTGTEIRFEHGRTSIPIETRMRNNNWGWRREWG